MSLYTDIWRWPAAFTAPAVGPPLRRAAMANLETIPARPGWLKACEWKDRIPPWSQSLLLARP